MRFDHSTNPDSSIRLARILALIALLVLVASGCGDPGPDDDSHAAASLYPNAAAASADWANMPDTQRDAMADGKLTFAEYEAAVFAFARCVEEHGYRFDGPTYNQGARRFEYGIAHPPGEGGPGSEGASRPDQVCYAELLGSVDAIWNYQNRPTVAELAVADEEYKACLLELGMVADDVALVPPWGTDKWGEWYGTKLMAEVQAPGTELPAWRECHFRVQEHTPTG